MNKSGTAKLLIATSILLIIAFQVYWIKKLYQEENNNFKKSTDIIFREAMYRVQAARFTGDTMDFKNLPGNNLFMSDVISSIQQIRMKNDSSKNKLVISLNSNDEIKIPERDSSFKVNRDTMIYVDTKKGNEKALHIQKFLEHNKILSDSIPLSRIDSLYSVLLAREGINLKYNIIKTGMYANDTASKKIMIRVDLSRNDFATSNVPVGFMSPVFYRAEFSNPTGYLLKKISIQLLLSFLLVALTITSFIFIYRNLLAQKRLTAIKNEFIGNITHELKTPIATVSVAIEAMKNFNALQNPERTQEYLGIAGQELNRLSLLVDKVLRLSMFETQQVELKYEWFDFKELFSEIMDSMELQFQKFNASVNVEIKGNDFSIMADRMHITSVLYNLLDNALKYSKDKPQINIEVESTEEAILLQVKDNGIGIPASYKEKIFDKFFRVPNGDRHNVKGYGLGLSYVAHIINGHKGTIDVESEEGSGTTFMIKLPRENGN
ncbi:MAG: HAMP domain-containing sensor histidine kinase [Ferruginibacter sp.]